MNVLILWDAGHGPNTPGKRTPPMPDGRQIREYEFNRPAVDKCIELSKAYGMDTVDLAPERDIDVSLTTRVERANKATREYRALHPDGTVLLVSVHFNAHKSEWDASTASGIEVFHNPGSTKGEALARAVLPELLKGTPVVNRGVKSVGFKIIRDTLPPAILCECGFMDHMDEALLMKDPEYHAEVATEIVTGIRKYLGVYTEEPEGTPLMNAPTATVAQAQAWARTHNAPQEFIDLAPMYWEIWPAIGLDPAIGYVQFAHETGFLYRDGKSMAGLDASYHNPCGLKTTVGGGDTQASAHTRFKDWRTGITAHADHAALYAGAPGYPKPGSPDPRHFNWIKGKAPTLEALGGRWAPSKTYGTNIRDKYLIPLQEIQVKDPDPVDPCAKVTAERNQLLAENTSLNAENLALRAEIAGLNKKVASAIDLLRG